MFWDNLSLGVTTGEGKMESLLLALFYPVSVNEILMYKVGYLFFSWEAWAASWSPSSGSQDLRPTDQQRCEAEQSPLAPSRRPKGGGPDRASQHLPSRSRSRRGAAQPARPPSTASRFQQTFPRFPSSPRSAASGRAPSQGGVPQRCSSAPAPSSSG